MFTRSPGRFMEGKTNYNVREERDHDGQVVVEKQTRSFWGTRYGKWDRDVNRANHKRARDYASDHADE